MIDEKQSLLLEDFLNREGISRKILIRDVEKAVSAELEANNKLSTDGNSTQSARLRRLRRRFDYSKFNRFRSVSHSVSFTIFSVYFKDYKNTFENDQF